MPQDAQKSPDDWAAELYPPISRERWRHDVAAAAHGWNLHQAQSGLPYQLTRELYTAAVDAAASGKVHEPAVSSFVPKPPPVDEQEDTGDPSDDDGADDGADDGDEDDDEGVSK